jgi:hypothetical protein
VRYKSSELCKRLAISGVRASPHTPAPHVLRQTVAAGYVTRNKSVLSKESTCKSRIMPYTPDMDTKRCAAVDRSVPPFPNIKVGGVGRVKALEPLTSTSAPSVAQVIEWSEKGIMLRCGRYMPVGAVVQLHLAGDFSLWKIFCCFPRGNSFHLGLEFLEPVAP